MDKKPDVFKDLTGIKSKREKPLEDLFTPKYMYHGTSSRRPNYEDGVFLTPNPNEAIGFAYGAVEKFGGTPVVHVVSQRRNSGLARGRSPEHRRTSTLDSPDILQSISPLPGENKEQFRQRVLEYHTLVQGYNLDCLI
jgi:hypothetical protein